MAHSSGPSNPLPDDIAPESPSDNEEHFEYPTIDDFFEGLMITENNRHNFTDFTESFHEQGYYQIDELADESVTVGHMVNIISGMRDGTARVIKKRVLEKVQKIRKGRMREQ